MAPATELGRDLPETRNVSTLTSQKRLATLVQIPHGRLKGILDEPPPPLQPYSRSTRSLRPLSRASLFSCMSF